MRRLIDSRLLKVLAEWAGVRKARLAAEQEELTGDAARQAMEAKLAAVNVRGAQCWRCLRGRVAALRALQWY